MGLPFTLPASAPGFGVGDLRNKAAKEAETARIREMQQRMEARPKREPPRCQCGRTWHELPTMWAHQTDRWSGFYCPACLPTHLAPSNDRGGL